MKKGKSKANYGYIEFIDKRKLKNDGWDDQIEPEIRKPTSAEREEIILNFIRDNSGQSIKITQLANVLAVSERTIQKHLRNLEVNGQIKRINQYNENNWQRASVFEYLGADTPCSEYDLTLKNLYSPDNPCGIRDWHWKDYKIILGHYTADFTKENAITQSNELKQRKNVLAAKKAKRQNK